MATLRVDTVLYDLPPLVESAKTTPLVVTDAMLQRDGEHTTSDRMLGDDEVFCNTPLTRVLVKVLRFLSPPIMAQRFIVLQEIEIKIPMPVMGVEAQVVPLFVDIDTSVMPLVVLE